MSAHGFRVFSSPFRGAFHLSLTVLVHYRSSRVSSLGGWSPQLPTEFHVLRGTQVPDHPPAHAFVYGALTRSGWPSQTIRLACLGERAAVTAPTRSYNPIHTTLTGLTCRWFGLFPVRSPLLGESRLIFFPPGTEMFQFPGLPRTALWIQTAVTAHHRGRVAPFGNLRINAC